MDAAAVSELKTLLVGAPLPAEKSDLLEYAVQQHAEPHLLDALGSAPDREYQSLDELAEQLLQVQPQREHEEPQEPQEESGRPPGGDAYTDAHADTGQVRDLDSVEGS